MDVHLAIAIHLSLFPTMLKNTKVDMQTPFCIILYHLFPFPLHLYSVIYTIGLIQFSSKHVLFKLLANKMMVCCFIRESHEI